MPSADWDPCDWCGHGRAHHSGEWFDPGCTHMYGEPDSCTCAGWQEPDE